MIYTEEKTILISKRKFDTKLNQNNVNISSRKFDAGEKFKFFEYAHADSKKKYVLITPISKKRNNDCELLLFNLNSLRSHFYIKCA